MVSVAGSTDSKNSGSGTLGASMRQPVVLVALQRPMLVTDRMFVPPTFTTYAVPVRGMSVKKFGPGLYRGPWSGAVARSAGGAWLQPGVDRHEPGACASGHGRRGVVAAGCDRRVAGRDVHDRDRTVVVVGDVDRVAGLVDRDPGRAAAHGDGARRLAAAAAGVPVAGGPVDHRHGDAVAVRAVVRGVDGVGRHVHIDRLGSGPGLYRLDRQPAASGGHRVTPGRV